jgi:hypothetical protein
VSWRVVAASQIGTSHVENGTACEDSCWGQVDVLPTGQPLLSVFVSDGAGSAAKGGEGAELAIQAAADFIAKKLKQGEFGLSDTVATDLVVAVRERIYSKAEADGLSARDFACTFLGVLSSPMGTLVLQIGDGGVVLDVGAGLEVAVVPMSGEYANMTHFVTDEDAISILVTKAYADPALRVAAFSDGLQRLALNMAANTPHEPFFAPFFNGMTSATLEQEDQLQALLLKFLGSAAVNERTDDDKTLALAVRLP